MKCLFILFIFYFCTQLQGLTLKYSYQNIDYRIIATAKTIQWESKFNKLKLHREKCNQKTHDYFYKDLVSKIEKLQMKIPLKIKEGASVQINNEQFKTQDVSNIIFFKSLPNRVAALYSLSHSSCKDKKRVTASLEKELISNINEYNAINKNVNSADCISCKVNKSEELWNKCIAESCGTDTISIASTTSKILQDSSSSEDFKILKSQMQSNVSLLIDDEINKINNFIQLLEESSSSNNSISDDFRLARNIEFVSSSIVNANLANSILNNKIMYEVNKIDSIWPKKINEANKQALELFLNSSVLEVRKLLLSVSASAAIKIIAQDKNEKNAIHKTHAKIKYLLNKLNQNNKKFLENPSKSFDLRFDEIFQKLIGNKNISNSDKNDLVKDFVFLYSISTFSEGDLRKALLQIDLNDFSSLAKNKELIKSLKTQIENYKKLKENMSEDQEIKICAQTVKNYLNISPNSRELLNFQREIEKVRNLSKKAIVNNFSNESSVKLNAYLDSLNIELPISREKQAEAFKKRMKNFRTAITKEREYIAKLSSSEQKYYYLSLSDSLLNVNKLKDNYKQMCPEDSNIMQLNDQALTNIDEIILSPLNLKLGKSFKTILAHELSHGISSQFSNNLMSQKSRREFVQQRSCLSSTHQGILVIAKSIMQDDSKKININEGQFSEEDWADFFASEIIQSDKNDLCVYFNENKEKNQSIKYQSNLDDFGQPLKHSTHLFRVLNYDYKKNGKIKPSCENYLKYTNQFQEFKKCN